VAGSCEYGNEPSGSIKCGEFFDWLRACRLLKKDFAPWSPGILQEKLMNTRRCLRIINNQIDN